MSRKPSPAAAAAPWEGPLGGQDAHQPVELVDPDPDVRLIDLAVLLAAVNRFDPTDAVGLGSVQVAPFDVVRVLAVVLRVQVLIHRLLLGALQGASQLDAAEEDGGHSELKA